MEQKSIEGAPSKKIQWEKYTLFLSFLLRQYFLKSFFRLLNSHILYSIFYILWVFITPWTPTFQFVLRKKLWLTFNQFRRNLWSISKVLRALFHLKTIYLMQLFLNTIRVYIDYQLIISILI